LSSPRDTSGGPVAAHAAGLRDGLSLWLLPIALWLVATQFFAGDLGRWSDDYAFTMIDQSTGRWERLAPPFGNVFSRPLHRQLTFAVDTLLWPYPRTSHLLLAALHALVTVLLWRVLRVLGRSPAASALGALLFLLATVHYEVVFWLSAISFAVATALLLGLFRVLIALVRGAPVARCLTALALGGFVVPCFNEQPAAALAALPALGLAAIPPGRRLRDAAPRIVAGSIAGGVGPLVYLVLFSVTATASYRGALGTWTAVERMPARIAQIGGEVLHAFLQAGFRAGAWAQGLTEIAAHPFRVAALTTLVLLAMLPWLARARSAAAWRADAARGDHALRRAAATLLFGALVFILSWLPLLPVPDQGVAPRLTYVPLAGLVIMATTLLDVALAGLDAHPTLRAKATALLTAGAALVMLPALIPTVGVQALFFHRARADERLTRALVQALPDPPHGTLLLPIDDASRPTETGFDAYDLALPGPFAYSWSAPYFVRWAYGRSDLFAAGRPPWDPARTRGDAESALLADVGLAPTDFPRDDDGLYRVPWSRVAPLAIARDGSVRLVTRVVVPTAGGGTNLVQPQPAVDGARRTGSPGIEITLR